MHLAPTVVEEAGRHALTIDREDTENTPSTYNSLCNFTLLGGSCSLSSSELNDLFKPWPEAEEDKVERGGKNRIVSNLATDVCWCRLTTSTAAGY